MQDRFRADVLTNRNNRAILDRWDALALPEGWLVAGCLFQTVWNRQAGRAPESDIKDYDLFYFDSSDLSKHAERIIQAHVEKVLADLNVPIEVANQASVHTWYESWFGHPCDPLRSSCDGIDHFLIPATCVGIRPDAIYAPNGFEGIYEGELTPNPLSPFANLFEEKTDSYRARWPWLRVVRAVRSGA